MDEIIEILEEHYTPKEIIEMLNNVLIKNNKTDRQLVIEKYALKHNLCPECGGDLVERIWKEYRGEHFGFPAHETLSELMCEDCYWS